MPPPAASRFTMLRDGVQRRDATSATGSRSARQGNPLFNEGLVAIEDKDLYSRTQPDAATRRSSGSTPQKPELAKLINLLVLEPGHARASRPTAPTSRASSFPI